MCRLILLLLHLPETLSKIIYVINGWKTNACIIKNLATLKGKINLISSLRQQAQMNNTD